MSGLIRICLGGPNWRIDFVTIGRQSDRITADVTASEQIYKFASRRRRQATLTDLGLAVLGQRSERTEAPERPPCREDLRCNITN